MKSHQLPDPSAIPGMNNFLKNLPDDVTILGIEPEVTFEWKLALYDAKIANNIEAGRIEAVGRLVEMREAIIQERFILTKDYTDEKNEVIKELEEQISDYLKRDIEEGATRLQFQQYRRIFLLQNKFLARNYPFKAHAKEKLRNWKLKG